MPGSCKTDCSGFVALPRPAVMARSPRPSNATTARPSTAPPRAAATCTARRSAATAWSTPGEPRDDGVNNGTYGTCTSTCQFAGYCGDGTSNGTEQSTSAWATRPIHTVSESARPLAPWLRIAGTAASKPAVATASPAAARAALGFGVVLIPPAARASPSLVRALAPHEWGAPRPSARRPRHLGAAGCAFTLREVCRDIRWRSRRATRT